nr:unnamed protein product [Digitaria exilis]
MIDQDSDRDATIVQLSFGDRLGALLDTMKALKDLGLDVTKGTVTTDLAFLNMHIMLYIETADRPGLLLEIIKIIADTNIDVESAEIDTEGLVAKDKFHVSYRGTELDSSLSQVLINCLRYYLRRLETDEDSY